MNTIQIPGFTAEAALYRTNNHYQFAAGGSFLSDGNKSVTPQGCGWIKGGICGAFIAGGIAVCTASCLASPALGGFPCYLCWTSFLGGTYGYCRDCIPGWMRALIDVFEGGGGSSGGSSSGGGGGPVRDPRRCCERNEFGRCIFSVPRNEACPGDDL